LAVCSVCGPEVAVRSFEFPNLSLDEMQGAVLLEAAQLCPFNIDAAAVDYQLISQNEQNVSGVFVAAANQLIRQKRGLVKNAELDCVLMDVDGLALLNCLSECEKNVAGSATAILNVGNSFSNLAISGDNAFPFIRDIAYAGDHITEQIASEKALPIETVRKILSGQYGDDQGQPDIDQAFEKACQKLIVDVTKTLRYYATQQKSTVVENVFVCGGFALVGKFVEMLDSQLPAKVTVWNPFEKIKCGKIKGSADILEKKGPAMAVAAGLAMRAI